MADARRLPSFIPPMLAQAGTPFDSPRYLYEIKWDGTRALAFVDAGGVRLMNRRERDIANRFPELECLEALPAGTVLDGEIVVLKEGKPDFQALQRREQAQSSFKIRQLAKALPCTYVVFDQLFAGFESIIDRPCLERRELARTNIARLACPPVVMSEGVIGEGSAYFERAVQQGLEGMVAKRVDSPYLPGRRSDAWVKIKRQEETPCVVVGYLTDERGGLRSLVLATQVDGTLRHVGQVGSGLTAFLCDEILARLKMLSRAESVVTCKVRGHWVEPEIYCQVRYMERTRDGHLRAPVLVKML